MCDVDLERSYLVCCPITLRCFVKFITDRLLHETYCLDKERKLCSSGYQSIPKAIFHDSNPNKSGVLTTYFSGTSFGNLRLPALENSGEQSHYRCPGLCLGQLCPVGLYASPHFILNLFPGFHLRNALSLLDTAKDVRLCRSFFAGDVRTTRL